MSPSTSRLLDEMFGRDPRTGVSLAFVATRDGEVVAERYGVQPANDFEAARSISGESTLISWSMAKSITHAAVGALVRDGLLDPDAPAAVPEWAGTDKEAITLDHLLQMRSGLAFVEDYVDGATSNCIEMLFSGNATSFGAYAASQPLVAEPGTVFNYSSGTTNIVTRIIGDVLSGGPGGSPDDRRAVVTQFLDDRIFTPSGMTSAIPKFDDAGDFVGSSFVYATARDFARFGELYLRDGVGVDGERVLPDGWVSSASERISHDAGTDLGYGRHWWSWPAFPGSLSCHGYEGQYVLVLPDRDLVLTHLGKTDVGHQPSLRMRLARIADSL